VVAIHEICGHAEHQERAGTIRTFGFTLSKALVTDERALLVVYESTKRQASKRPGRQISVHLARRDETRQNFTSTRVIPTIVRDNDFACPAVPYTVVAR
jgi:hypothetical protein